MAYGSVNVPGKLTPEDIGAAAADHTHTAADVGAAAASHGTHVSYSSTAPKMDGTAAVGTAGTVARSDHVHPTDTSRAAASHTHTAADVGAVPTTRKVNNKALSADISLTASDVGALASGGTAAAATKLATARTIQTNLGSASAASFNGTANVTPGVTGTLGVANGGTGNTIGYVRAGQKSGTTIGSCATAEGKNTTASGSYSHAEGYYATASEDYSHAEGYNTASSGYYSHTEGNSTTASGSTSHAGGLYTIAAGTAQTATGSYNVESALETDKLIIGKGTESSRANCFRVTHTGVYATGAHNSTGADYAELFEWLEGNPAGEDRVGRFVTLDGEKIRLAGPGDDFILGIISGNPSVVGDVHDDQWQGMYLYDIYGRPIWEDVEVPDETVEEPDPENPENTVTRVVIPAHTEHRQKINPDYDNTQKYIPCSERPEWGCVGMMGKLVVIDDGSCQPNGWCAPGEGGAATASAERTDYRVLARIDETHVRVLVLGRR